MERYLYRKAERILTVIPGSDGHIVERGALRERIVWLPQAVDFGFIPLPTPPGERSPFTIMYAGAHGLADDLDSVLDAAVNLQQDGWGERVRFRLLGDGAEKPRLQQRARDEGIQVANFEPPIAKRRVYKVLQEADAFIATTPRVYRSGVSLTKLSDYLACARPVVYAGSLTNPVAEAGAGITAPPQDPKGIAEAVKQLAETPLAERIAMGQRGRAYVEKHYNIVNVADKFEQVLKEIEVKTSRSQRSSG
jgi:glycosyltransferase involved in cell wall biosynthesis